MKLARIICSGRPLLCAVLSDGLVDLSPAGISSVEAAIACPEVLPEAIEKCAAGPRIAIEDAHFLPPVSAPEKILCVGVNYKKHIQECGETLPTFPVLFSKFNNALAAHGEVIQPPACSSQIDYEAELVVVMGRKCKNVRPEDAHEYVFGYTCGNDLSARDLQLRTSQWIAGKTPDHFAPVGPWIVTADELNPHSLPIESRLNGEVCQCSNTENMIFPIEEIISYISSIMTLEPGDLIFTGTPEGVILGREESLREWMKEGDVIEIEIGGIGVLRNAIGKSI